MHVDSWWDSYLEHGGTPKTSVYIYIQRCTYDSNIRFGKFLLYEYIVPDNYNIQNILYIHRIFQNARRQLVGFLLRTWRNPQNLCIYIQRCTYDSNIRFGKFLLYEYIVPDNYNIQNILYIHRIFQNARRQLVGFLLRTWRNPQNLCVYIYSDVHTIRTSGLESFYYMNIQCRTTTIFKIYYIYTGFSKMHVDSWWDSYLEHGGTPKTSVHIYIYIQRCTYDSNIRFGKFLLYEYIVPDNYNIQNILYIHRIFQNARRQLVGFLLRTWRNPQNLCVYIYIQRCTYDSNIRFGKFLLYEYIVPDNYNIQNILYIHRIFQNARRQLVGFLLRTWRNPQNLCVCVYIYSDVHTIRTSGLESFYYMNIQCRTTTIFKIYYIYTGFSKMHVDSWWDSYLEHGGTPKTSVYIYIQRCTYDSNIRFGKFLLYEYIVPDNYNIQNILYIHRIFQNARRQLVGFLLRTWRNPQNLCVYIYSDVHTIRTSGLESFYYMNIQCRTTTIFKIYYIYTGFSKMHVDSWWDSYLEHGGTPKTSVYIYIAMYIRFEHQDWKFLLYEYIVPDNYNIQNILYIHRIFQNARRQLVGFLLIEHGGTPKTSVYIYIAMYIRFEHQVWKVFII